MGSTWARIAALAAGLALIAGLFVGGAQPVAVGLIPSPWDKLAHAALFALVGGLLTIAAGGRRAALVIGLVLAVALADELAQVRLPGREASAADLAADVAGALAGVGAMALALARRARRPRRAPNRPEPTR
jgi:VanZ family protein